MASWDRIYCGLLSLNEPVRGSLEGLEPNQRVEDRKEDCFGVWQREPTKSLLMFLCEHV